MSETKYTEDHEWVTIEDEDIAIVGITDFAQDQLGELVYVELPEVGQEFSKGENAAVIESVKAAGDVKAPVSGTIIEVNETLADEPGLVNEDPTGDGWFIKLKMTDPAELNTLLDEAAYKVLIS
ncbi:MAG: glycine cleavage system protein GcvH [Gammaproteobacteria bacterium]|nr:glycine cleavage system protein GcvH [Gammaproteobacteria bacterium]